VVGIGLGWVVQSGRDGVGGFFCPCHTTQLDMPEGIKGTGLVPTLVGRAIVALVLVLVLVFVNGCVFSGWGGRTAIPDMVGSFDLLI
jgi:hypothetical protein